MRRGDAIDFNAGAARLGGKMPRGHAHVDSLASVRTSNMSPVSTFDMDGAAQGVRTGLAVRRWYGCEQRLDRRIEHEIGVVPSMRGDGFRLDQIAALDGQHRR